jgi:hypothetical protein
VPCDRTFHVGLEAKTRQTASRSWHRSRGRRGVRIISAVLTCGSVALLTGGYRTGGGRKTLKEAA